MCPLRQLLSLTCLVSSLLLVACGSDNHAAAAPAWAQSAATEPMQPAPADDAGYDESVPPRNSANPQAAPNPLGSTKFVRYEAVDPHMNGMPIASVAIPQGWLAQSSVDWDMTNGNNPTRGHSRFEAPDHSAWVENFPVEIFSWLSVNTRQRPGTRSFGAIHYPNVTSDQALRLMIGQYRGNKRNLQIVGSQVLPNLAQSMLHQNVQGDSLAIRVRYEENGQPVEEDFYGFLAAQENIPSDSPVGRMWEFHRGLWLLHSMGARQGNLDNVYPLVNFIVTSGQSNPAWQDARKQAIAVIGQNFKRHMATTYAQIAAAAQRSRVSAQQSDAWLKSFDAARVAANARSAAQSAGSSGGDGSGGDGFTFDDYIRGTERMNDPSSSTGETALSYNNIYHWTDGNGNYQNTNDPSVNPNVGSNQNWILMTRAGKQ